MQTLRDKLQTQLDEVQAQCRAITEKDKRTDADEANLRDLLAQGEMIKSRAAELDSIDALRLPAKINDVQDAANATHERAEQRNRTTTPGAMFTRSRAYSEYGFVGVSGRLEVPMFERAAGDPPTGLLTTADFGRGGKTQFVVENPLYQTPLLDLIGVVPISTNSVEYVKYAFTNNAAEVEEGHIKPRSAFSRTLTPKAVPTVAHWVEASRQLLEDESAVRSMIDDELKSGVLVKLEGRASAALTGASLPTADGAGDLLAGIRNGKAKLPKGYTASAVLLNPDDWAAFDIAVMKSTVLGPVITQTFWGMTPVSDPDVAAGTAILGDFVRCVKMFRRTDATVYITDSDVGEDGVSNFKRNIFTLLGEARALVDVVDARGLVKVSTGTAPEPPAGG